MSCLRGLWCKPRRGVAQAKTGAALTTAFNGPALRNRTVLTYTRHSYASSTDAHSVASSAPLLDNPLSRRGFYNYTAKLTNGSSFSGDKGLARSSRAYEQLAASAGATGAAQDNSNTGASLSQGLLQAM